MTSRQPVTLELIRPSTPLSYAAGLELQQRLFDRIVAGRAEASVRDACVNTTARPAAAGFAGGVVLLEHTPTITLGREALPGDLLRPADQLKALGIEVLPTDRGGEVTVHAPGQWVMYPVIDLTRFDRSVTGHIRRLEEVAIRTAARFGVTTGRIDGVSGAWVRPSAGAGGPEEKICAVGIAVRKWIARHGLCFNVAAAMPVYAHIVPCGQRERGVTSLQRLTGTEDTAALMQATATALLSDFAEVFGVEWRPA